MSTTLITADKRLRYASHKLPLVISFIPKTILVPILGLVFIFLACSKESTPPEEPTAPSAPQNLTVSEGDLYVTLSWEPSGSEGEENFAGYFIFMANRSIAEFSGFSELLPYLVNDTPIDSTSYRIENLIEDSTYFVHIRAALNEGGSYLLSSPTEECSFTARILLPAPEGIDFEAGEGEITVSWERCLKDTLHDFAGYFLYLSTRSFELIDEDSLTSLRYNPAPTPDTTVLVAELSEGVIYYFAVSSARNKNGEYRESELSEEVDAAVVRLGDGTIYEYFSGGESGFDFSDGMPFLMTSENANFVDIYLGTVAENDSAGLLCLKSPHLVFDPSPVWNSVISRIKVLGDGAFSDYTETDDSGWNTEEMEVVLSGRTYCVKTPDNHFVKLAVTGTYGIFPERYITFRYSYQPVINYGKF